ncbi:right-handed parallel beta-helix repeat-containing protein [Pyrobaculum sp.]|uniref:right-handed parallel beta-helix repeat-containing protein n=1 Tax=Pyrobaculum sp. TaxID=2004705 RepID=UPI00317A5B3E
MPITSCTIIRRPGYYYLANDLEGTLVGEDYCILIISDNVILDGNGKSINPHGKNAVVLKPHVMTVRNITIINTTFLNVDIAILVDQDSRDIIITNNVFSSGLAVYTRNFISRCRISNNIFLDSSVKAKVYECEITDNKFINGSLILIDQHNTAGYVKNIISYNEFQNGGLRFDAEVGIGRLGGGPMLYVVENNTVNGKPLIYIQNRRGINLENIEAGQIVIVASEDIKIRNIRISNTEAGIVLFNVVGTTVTECNIRNARYGIYVLSSRDIKIEKCKFDRNNIGIFISRITREGPSKNILIANSTLIENKKGIVVKGVEMLKIHKLSIKNNYIGAEIDDSNNINMEHCQIDENGEGLQVNITTDIEIRNSNIMNNKIGLNAREVKYLIISNLEVKNNEIGITLNFPSNIKINDIKIENNKVGIVFNQGTNISFMNNLVEKNELGVKVISTSNFKLSKNTYTKNNQAISIIYFSRDIQVTDSIFAENVFDINISGDVSVWSEAKLNNITLLNGKVGLIANRSTVIASYILIKNYAMGAFITNYSDVTIDRCIVEKVETGFSARKASLTVMNCRLSNYEHGFIYIDELRRFNIINNIFENGKTAIWIRQISSRLPPCPQGKIINNTIINNYVGINITKTGNIFISNNTFSKNTFGVFLMNSSQVDIRYNVFYTNKIGIYDYGYLWMKFDRNTIMQNKFINNRVAIRLTIEK